MKHDDDDDDDDEEGRRTRSKVVVKCGKCFSSLIKSNIMCPDCIYGLSKYDILYSDVESSEKGCIAP